MTPDLDRALCERYPLMFAERSQPMTKTAMFWGFDCDDGWYTLIDTLCTALQQETDSGNAPQVVATQVKEKYGGLRFYVHSASQRQMAMIDFAESLSERTCEICSFPGTQNQDDWVRTRCKGHNDPPNRKEPENPCAPNANVL